MSDTSFRIYMETERFVERILETENLTDELEDADANWFLKWGTGKVPLVLMDVSGDEEAGYQINALMAVMRKINRMMASYQDKTAEVWQEDFTDLNAMFIEAFGGAEDKTFDFQSPEFLMIFGTLSNKSSRQVLEYLLCWPGWLENVIP
jgi:hypothetical protein